MMVVKMPCKNDEISQSAMRERSGEKKKEEGLKRKKKGRKEERKKRGEEARKN